MKRSRRPVELLALILAATAAAACSHEVRTEAAAGETTDSPQLSLASAVPSTEAGAYHTHLYSEHDADVVSQWSSNDNSAGLLVTAIQVELGDRVHAGQVLATLDDDESQIAVQAARADADEARSNFERVSELRKKELTTPAEYDSALSAKKRAEAALAQAALQLSRTRVRAPFAGVISRRYVRVGERVEEGQPLFRVTAMSPLRARLLVPEDQAGAFRVGSSVMLNGVTGESATARVILMSPTIDPGSGTREVIVELSKIEEFRPGAAIAARPLVTEEGSSK